MTINEVWTHMGASYQHKLKKSFLFCMFPVDTENQTHSDLFVLCIIHHNMFYFIVSITPIFSIWINIQNGYCICQYNNVIVHVNLNKIILNIAGFKKQTLHGNEPQDTTAIRQTYLCYSRHNQRSHKEEKLRRGTREQETQMFLVAYKQIPHETQIWVPKCL